MMANPPFPIPFHPEPADDLVHAKARRFNLTPLPLQFSTLAHVAAHLDEVARAAVDAEGLSPRSRAWMKTGVRAPVRFLMSDAASERDFLSGVADVQVAVLVRWVAWMRTCGLQRTTISAYWRGAAAAFQRLEVATAMFNPFACVRAPRPSKPLPRCLTRDDAQRVLTTVRNMPWRTAFERERNLAIVGLMLMAGLRQSEVLNLEYGDVNLADRTIRIRRGKGRNGGKDRTAYATPQLMEVLDAYMTVRTRERRSHGAFISSTREDRAIGEVTIRRLFRKLSGALKLRVTPHMLRHTYATLLRQSGVADRVAQELLGHSSLAALQRYSHVYEGECATEAARLRFDV